MDEKIIEVRHIGNQNEPRFEIWLREITIDKPLNGISTVISENFRKVAVAVNVTEPSKWPVPVKKETNLQKSINWLFEDYNLYQSELNSQRAKHIKQSLYDWGENVFFQIFSNKEILAFYAMLQKERKGCIHIISAYADILSWPWEAVFSFDTSPI